jgi:acyl-coenzyme A thioesterase PaaI-like protein
MLPDFFVRAMEENVGENLKNLLLPPPVFSTLPCEFTAFDRESAILVAHFKIMEGYLNPYGTVQGGILAGFADNTIGPLSMMIAAPNMTRRFEMKYSLPVTMDTDWVEVSAHLASCEGRILHFSADIRDPSKRLMARARAVHWLLGK